MVGTMRLQPTLTLELGICVSLSRYYIFISSGTGAHFHRSATIQLHNTHEQNVHVKKQRYIMFC